MQYTSDGRTWRDRITVFLDSLDVVVVNPYDNIIDGFSEKHEVEKVNEAFLLGDYLEVSKLMRRIRNNDLRAIDICDFVIAYVNVEVPMCGTYEEIFTANRQKKPVFIVVEGGRDCCPFWLFGTTPLSYIHEDFESLCKHISVLDSGDMEMGDRWKLLNPKLR